MNITLVVYGPTQEVVGRKEHVREVRDGATVGDVFEDLVAEYPGLAEYLYSEDGDLNAAVSVTVDGTNVARLDGLATELDGGEELRLAPAIHGG